ncbi:Hsp20/alpha crystallin family protein [Candidatus Megaera polyxenophila]|nr:Hsp20/alpha crystallin family protein [Candidatus Megaera polyxenophila]
MNVTDQKSTNCKWTNCKVILVILGFSTCLFLASTIYFLVKCYNQNQIISEQLLEYKNQLNYNKPQPLLLDDNFERRMKKLFDEMSLIPRTSLFNLIDRDFFNSHIRGDNLLNDNYLNHSTIEVLDKEYLITLAIPGFTREQLKLELNGNTLTISAENKEQSDENNTKKNINSKFKQVISLNTDIERNSIKSSLKDGILTISIPRTQQKGEPQTINIE